MRILIISDVHANWAALRSIDEEFDACLCLGDLVDYGVEPGPCVDWAMRHVTHGVRGNHDHGAAQDVRVRGVGGFRYITAVTRPLTVGSLSDDHRRYLMRRPLTQQLTIGGKRFFLAHATPRDPLDEYGVPCPDFWRRRLEHVNADYVLVGHTHRPYDLDVDGVRVVNPGSVGQPRDGDPRMSYAVIDGDGVQIKRVAYPIEDAVGAVQECELDERSKQLLAELYRSGTLGCMPSKQKRERIAAAAVMA